nr:transmembrane protein 243 isoform X2 [Camelus dromedarius]XP_031310690.1 transmembrane protein 243 isoform X2 [Camelus dromedarius]
MEDFSTRTYGTSGLDNRPLFGETSAKEDASRLSCGFAQSQPTVHTVRETQLWSTHLGLDQPHSRCSVTGRSWCCVLDSALLKIESSI